MGIEMLVKKECNKNETESAIVNRHEEWQKGVVVNNPE